MGKRKTIVVRSGFGLALGIFLFGFSIPGLAQADGSWEELKGKHFVVHFKSPVDQSFARKLLRRAEQYYGRIGRDLGLKRFDQFWTWDERVRLVVFPSQEEFMAVTGQPAWSTGYADRDSRVFQSRSIVTFRQEKEFFDGLLPHEIAHLILHDYVAPHSAPIWFDEGVAQYYEILKRETARRIVRKLIVRRQYVPLRTLHRWDVRKENDPAKVTVFYAQSLSIVDFLMAHYGRAAFARLCRGLKDGKGFEEALRHAYSNQMNSFDDLEKKWARYFQRN